MYVIAWALKILLRSLHHARASLLADNNFLLRTACKAKCLEHDACIGYWYYSHSLFSSCFLDGASLNGTKAMAAALGPGWQADTDDPFGDAFCGNACDVNATDHNKHGGTAECYARVRTRTSSADNGEALA